MTFGFNGHEWQITLIQIKHSGVFCIARRTQGREIWVQRFRLNEKREWEEL